MRGIAKKYAAFLLALMLFAGLLPAISLPAAAAGSGKISMSNAEGVPGDTVRLEVKLTSNPGLVTLRIQVEYDTAVLELVKVEDTGLVKGSTLNPTYSSPYTIAWMDDSAVEDNRATGTIAVFSFKIKGNAPVDKVTIQLKCLESYSFMESTNSFSAIPGTVTVGVAECQTHTYSNAESVDDDNHSRTCTVCHYVEKEKHSYSVWEVTEENHSRSCDVCGHVQSGVHSWDEGTVLEQATCQAGGLVKYTCKTCATSYEDQTDPADTHTYDHGCDADCNVCGQVRTTEHTFSTKWSKDKTHHWYECTECKEKTELAEHIPGPEATQQTAQTCTVCAQELVPALSHKHDAAREWTSDELGHWHTCSGCEEKVDYADHAYQDDCDADCDVCGYTRQAPHTYPEGWLNDGENHWRICDLCNEKILFAAHIPGVEATVDAPQYCTECGYELAPALEKTAWPEELMYTAPYGWPWWANTIAVIVILGSIAALIVIPLKKKK